MAACPATWAKRLMKKLHTRIQRHAQTFWFVLTVVLPIILRTRQRPVIFSKFSGIGDIICTIPAALELKKRHPKATFIYNCHQPYGVLPVMGGITNITTYLRQPFVLKHWYGWLFAGFYEFPCADELPDDFCKQYVVKEYANDHGVIVADAHPHLEIQPSIRERVNEILKSHIKSNSPLIVIQTGPSWPIREWPQAAWASLIVELKRILDAKVVQIGTDHQLAVGKRDVFGLPGVVSLVNQLTLEESCAVVAGSHLFIGIDSGLLHVAASLRVPCVGIFGPTSPHLRLPEGNVQNCIISQIKCQGCHHRIPRIHWESGCPYDAACMKNIPAAEVLATCIRLLAQNQT
jgi:ADP-heptose:LPS heptosyltransferase